MSAGFTPGPWFVTGSERLKYVEARIGNGMLQEVASCMICEKGDIDANARLIAAAPDLLEALKHVAHRVVMDGRDLEIVSAAIAKAAGEAA